MVGIGIHLDDVGRFSVKESVSRNRRGLVEFRREMISRSKHVQTDHPRIVEFALPYHCRDIDRQPSCVLATSDMFARETQHLALTRAGN